MQRVQRMHDGVRDACIQALSQQGVLDVLPADRVADVLAACSGARVGVAESAEAYAGLEARVLVSKLLEMWQSDAPSTGTLGN